MVAAADVFDALTTSRPYEQAWGLDAGLANLRAGAGVLYDATCVAAFLATEEEVRELAGAVTK